MCFLLVFKTIPSECLQHPEHIVTTNAYFVCNHAIAAKVEARIEAQEAARAAAKAHADANAAAAEIKDLGFELVFGWDSDETSPSAQKEKEAARVAAARIQNAGADIHCDESMCRTIGDYGSCRVRGPCTYCRKGCEEPLTLVISNTDDILRGFFTTLVNTAK
ncbi:uncharacterized protein BJX67DRAFT_384855 [Aspergillus lucknowensis]|uniref:Uncharacterized protein n=1 Tax=Aspergillus lucknowensis TaxID=176173 RepID=A0ABR4LFB7_9EURO